MTCGVPDFQLDRCDLAGATRDLACVALAAIRKHLPLHRLQFQWPPVSPFCGHILPFARSRSLFYATLRNTMTFTLCSTLCASPLGVLPITAR
jgi:hypothetical protein